MADDTQQKSGTSRGVKIALALSLAANLLIVGLAVGVFTQVQRAAPAMKFNESGGAYTRALTPQDRRSIGREMGERFRTILRDREPARADYERMIEILSAETFDREAAQAVLQSQAQVAQERRALSEELLLDRLAAMTPEERANFAARLTNTLQRPPKGPGRN